MLATLFSSSIRRGSIALIRSRRLSSSATAASRSASVWVRLPSTLTCWSLSSASWSCSSRVITSDLEIRSCSLSSIEAWRSRSCRIDSDLPRAKMPTKLSHPVFERICSKSLEKPAVTSSRPMISSAMLAFIASVCLCTSASVALAMSSEGAFTAASVRAIRSSVVPISVIFDCVAATSRWLSMICWSRLAMREDSVHWGGASNARKTRAWQGWFRGRARSLRAPRPAPRVGAWTRCTTPSPPAATR